MNPVFLDLARSDFRDAEVAEQRHQVDAASPVLAVDVLFVTLSLGDDVVLMQVVFGHVAKHLFALDLSGAESSAKLLDTVLGDFLGFREARFFGAGALILA